MMKYFIYYSRIILASACVASSFAAEMSLTTDSFPGSWSAVGVVDVHASRMGSKYIRLSAAQGGNARLSSIPLPIAGKKAVEISLNYRSDVADSRKDYGAWILLTIQDKQGQSLGVIDVVCPQTPMWRDIRRYVNLPEGAVQISAQVRLQASGGEFDISKFTLLDCEPKDSTWEAKEGKAFETVERFEMNKTGAEPDSISLMLWEEKGTEGKFMARLSSDNPSMKADLFKRGVRWRKGESHTVRMRFGAQSLEGWIDGVSWGSAVPLQNSFTWKKDRPFFLGGESASDNPWLGKIEKFSLTVLRPMFQIVFDGARQAGYFTGPGPHTWGFTFSKGEGEGVAVTLRVKNQQGEDMGEVISLKSSSPDRRDFELPSLPYGCYELQVSSEKKGKTSVERRSLAVTPPLVRGPAPESSFGITTPLSLQGDHFNETLVRDAFQRIAASGDRWFRLWVRWDDIEDAPGHYQWSNLDRVVELAQENGLELYPCLTGGALPFQTTEPLKKERWGMMTTACYEPPNLELWKNYLRAFAERYKGKIGVYQIWNEPDAKNGFYPFSPKAYVEVLKASAETLRAVDPSLRIGLGGFASALIGGGGKTTYSQTDSAWSGSLFYAEHPSSYFDIVDLHYYSVFEPDQSWDRNVRAARATHRFLESIGEGGKPLWNSETSMYSGKEGEIGGWGNTKYLSEQAQGMELIRFYVQSLAVGIQRSFWYCLFGEMGIIQEDFSPKPAYTAQVNVARLLQGARFVEELHVALNVRAYRFQVSGREVIALWSTGDTMSMGITHGGKEKWTQVDAFGNEQPHEETSTLLKLTGDPIFLCSEGPLAVKPLANLSLAPWTGTYPANTVLLSLFNPSNAAVKVSYDFTSGGVESAVKETQLAPGEEKSLNLELLSMINPVLAEVRFSGGIDQLLEIKQELPFRKIIRLGAQSASLSLDSMTQVKIGHETKDLQGRVVSAATWKGAKDVSAKINLHRVGGNIVFQAVVTDDQVVPSADARLWNGDCLEIFLTRNVGTEDTDSYQVMVSADGRISWRSDHAWKGFEAKTTKTPEGYVVDGSFPMEKESVGLNIAVDDADDLNGRKSQLLWEPDQDGILSIEP